MPLLALYADAWLVIAGSGVMEPALRSMAAASGVGDRIRLVGFVTGDLKRRVYRAADLFVLPSVMTTEVFPMVLLEASTFGLPLIVSDLPTFEALVAHEQNGLVAARGDQDALTRTFARLIADEPLRHALGREAQRRVAAYDWRRLAEQHESLYLDAISRRRAGERPRRS